MSGGIHSDMVANSDALHASRSDTASPPVEVVDLQAEEDADFAAAQPQVTLLGDDQDDQNSILVDPAPDFPYHTAMETPAEIMAKLLNYISTGTSLIFMGCVFHFFFFCTTEC